MRRTSGFTLIEMIVVIAIFGLLAAVLVPKVTGTMTQAQVNQATMLVAHDLMTAESNAQRERKPIRVTQGSGHQSFTVTDRTSGTTLFTRQLGSGDAYQLDSISFSTTPVDIFPSGFTSGAVTLTLWAKGYSRTVTMSRVGWVMAH